MRRVLAVLILMVAAACSCAGVQQVTQEAAASMIDSTVTVEVHYTGHQVITHPVTGAILEGQVPEEYGRTGSGVIFAKSLGIAGPIRSRILTANHVLDGPKVGEVVEHEGLKIRIDRIAYSITTSRNKECELTPLKFGQDQELNDVASAVADCDAGPAAPIADLLPPVGTKIVISSHPAGIRPALITEGYISGWTADGYILTSAPVIGGSSGAPIWYNGQVISLLVRVNPSFHHASFGVPLTAVQLRVLESY